MTLTPVAWDKVLYRISVIYSIPGVAPTLVDNVMTFEYDQNPDRLVVHHNRDQRTDILTDNIRLVHVTVQ